MRTRNQMIADHERIRRKYTGVKIERKDESGIHKTGSFCPGCGRLMPSLVYIWCRQESRRYFYLCDNCLLDMYLELANILEVGTLDTGTNPTGFTTWYGGDVLIHEYLLEGKKISAIKRWHELTGKDLKDSKDAIDRIVARMGHRYGSVERSD